MKYIVIIKGRKRKKRRENTQGAASFPLIFPAKEIKEEENEAGRQRRKFERGQR